MNVAFIIASLVVIGTVIIALLQYMAAGMSDNPSDYGLKSVGATLMIGLGIAAIIASSHWWNMGW
jgi:hypothetical protein